MRLERREGKRRRREVEEEERSTAAPVPQVDASSSRPSKRQRSPESNGVERETGPDSATNEHGERAIKRRKIADTEETQVVTESNEQQPNRNKRKTGAVEENDVQNGDGQAPAARATRASKRCKVAEIEEVVASNTVGGDNAATASAGAAGSTGVRRSARINGKRR